MKPNNDVNSRRKIISPCFVIKSIQAGCEESAGDPGQFLDTALLSKTLEYPQHFNYKRKNFILFVKKYGIDKKSLIFMIEFILFYLILEISSFIITPF